MPTREMAVKAQAKDLTWSPAQTGLFPLHCVTGRECIACILCVCACLGGKGVVFIDHGGKRQIDLVNCVVLISYLNSMTQL